MPVKGGMVEGTGGGRGGEGLGGVGGEGRGRGGGAPVAVFVVYGAVCGV